MNLQPAYCRCHHEDRADCPDRERTVISRYLAWDPSEEIEGS